MWKKNKRNGEPGGRGRRENSGGKLEAIQNCADESEGTGSGQELKRVRLLVERSSQREEVVGESAGGMIPRA